ncbi:hypothetical protein MASR2M48_08080 [Spirochaetota bacterium]
MIYNGAVTLPSQVEVGVIGNVDRSSRIGDCLVAQCECIVGTKRKDGTHVETTRKSLITIMATEAHAYTSLP